MNVDEFATQIEWHAFLHDPVPVMGVLTQRQIFQVRDFESVQQFRSGILKTRFDEAEVSLCQPSVPSIHRFFGEPAKRTDLAMEYPGLVYAECVDYFWERPLKFAYELVSSHRPVGTVVHAGAPSMAVVSPWAILMSVPWFTFHAVLCVTASTSAAAEGCPLPDFFTPPNGR